MDVLLRGVDTVFLLELVMICAIMVVGCYVSYTDIQFREISNLASWGLLGLGLTGQLGFWALGKTGLMQMGGVLAGGFMVSYLLYLYGFWAPGDAKLFWAVVVALPPTLFGSFWSTTSLPSEIFWSRAFFSFDMPLWALLLNAILLNFLFLLSSLVYHRLLRRRSSVSTAKAEIKTVAWLRSALEIAALSGLVSGGAVLVLGRALAFAEATILVLVLYLIITRIVNQDYRLILVIPGLVLGLYVSLGPQTLLVYLTLWVVTWAIQTIYVFLRIYAPQAFVQVLPIHALHQGMVPRVAICCVPNTNSDNLSYFCTEKVRDDQEVVCHPGHPLSDNIARKLRDMSAKGLFNNFDNCLEVELALPFAPALILSTMVTVLLGGSMAEPAISLLRQWYRVLFP